MSADDRTGYPGHCPTGHNRRLLYIGHRGIGHGGRPISFGYRCSHGRRFDGSPRHNVDDPVIVVACYPYSGRIDARCHVSMYSKARSGEPEPALCGSAFCIHIVRPWEIETGKFDNVTGEGT